MLWLVAGVLALVGAAALFLGARSERQNDHPICRACRFDLVGLYPSADICPECGNTLTPPGAVRVGASSSRPWLVVLAVPLLLGGMYTGILAIDRLAMDDMLADYASWTTPNETETRRRGLILIQALNAFHAEHGAYPAGLDLLPSGASAPELRPTTGHDEWLYSTEGAGESFRLYYCANDDKYPICWYSSKTGLWECDQ